MRSTSIVYRLSFLGAFDVVLPDIGSMGLINGLLDRTLLGVEGVMVLGVEVILGGVCVINSKPPASGVNVGFWCRCASGPGGVALDDGACAGGSDGTWGTQHLHLSFPNNHRWSRYKIIMIVDSTAHASIPIKI